MDELSIYKPNEIAKSNIEILQIEDLPPYEIQDYDVFDEKDFKLTDDEFELVCDFVYEWIIGCEAKPYEVLERLYNVVTEDDYYKFSNIDYYWNDLVEEINRLF